MSDLPDILRHVFSRFGRPWGIEHLRATDANLDQIDTRLTSVERRQQGIANRLDLLEAQARPRDVRQQRD